MADYWARFLHASSEKDPVICNAGENEGITMAPSFEVWVCSTCLLEASQAVLASRIADTVASSNQESQDGLAQVG